MLKEKIVKDNSLNELFNEYNFKNSEASIVNENNNIFKKAISKIKEKGTKRLVKMMKFSKSKYRTSFIGSIILSFIFIPILTMIFNLLLDDLNKINTIQNGFLFTLNQFMSIDFIVYLSVILPTFMVIIIPSLICYQHRKTYKMIENFLSSDKYDNYFEKYLPLTSDKLNIITQNNPLLKEYILDNKDECFDLHQINKILDKEDNNDVCKIHKRLSSYIKKPDNFIKDILEKDFNDLEKYELTKSIKEEQSKLSYKNNLVMKKYKVIYAIENGPTKEIFIQNSFQDKDFFKDYINNIVLNEYNRKFEIISINEA